MEDPRVQAFRKELNKWKKEKMFDGLVNEGNSDSEHRRLEEAKEMFQTLMKRIQEMEKEMKARLQVGGNAAVDQILSALGPEERWSEAMLDKVRSILITDLVEYPFTFNATLIEQFKEQPDFPTYQ
jgi:hypothetical protein